MVPRRPHIPFAPHTPSIVYNVISSEERVQVPTRKKAVERARMWSSQSRGRVLVTGTDEPVRMIYAGGSIIEFEHRTGGRR